MNNFCGKDKHTQQRHQMNFIICLLVSMALHCFIQGFIITIEYMLVSTVAQQLLLPLPPQQSTERGSVVQMRCTV